jgi:hypothetical protein
MLNAEPPETPRTIVSGMTLCADDSRAHAKQASRDADRKDLEAGCQSHAQLKREHAVFAPLARGAPSSVRHGDSAGSRRVIELLAERVKPSYWSTATGIRTWTSEM